MNTKTRTSWHSPGRRARAPFAMAADPAADEHVGHHPEQAQAQAQTPTRRPPRRTGRPCASACTPAPDREPSSAMRMMEEQMPASKA